MKVASLSPLVVTSSRLKYQTWRGFLRKSEASPLPISMFQVHCTSLAENGLPSCHLTPSRSLNVNFVLVGSHDQLVAISGTRVSALSCDFNGSNLTRVLEIRMKRNINHHRVSSS